MLPEKVIVRYLGVKALAEQGAPGERDNARKILARLRKKHPGIKQQAAEYQARHAPKPDSEPSAGPETQTHHAETSSGYDTWRPGSGGPTGPGGPGGNWENIFTWAQSAAQNVYGFAQQVGNVVAGRQLATRVASSVRVSRTNNILLTLKMSMETYESAADLNAIQLRAFRDAMHELLDEKLDEMFEVD